MGLIGAGLLLFAVSLGLAGLFLPPLERQAMRTGPVDRPGGRKDHGAPTPLAGGIAILLAVCVPSVAGLLLSLLGGIAEPFFAPEIRDHLPGVRSKAGELLAILAGSGVMLLLGHLDDRRSLSPWLRLLVQAGCAAALAALGLRITLYLDAPALQVLVTVVFVVFVTNAVNFIDNMNGLMGGVLLASTLHLLTLAVATHQLFMAAILICLAGGLLAFLPRNFPRARVFVGDAGSMSLGFLLAALTVAFTFESGPPSARPAILPLLLLAVPLADGATAVVSRLRRGVHPFTAGHDHLSHRLIRLGLSPRRAVLLLWAAQILCGVPVIVLGAVPLSVLAAVWVPVAVLAGWYALRSATAGSNGP